MVGIRFGFVYSVRLLKLPIAKACREYGISRTTGYSWLKRYDIGPERLMTDYSRRPHHIPTATPAIVARQILANLDGAPETFDHTYLIPQGQSPV